jgi:hypothetical protein
MCVCVCVCEKNLNLKGKISSKTECDEKSTNIKEGAHISHVGCSVWCNYIIDLVKELCRAMPRYAAPWTDHK